MILWAFEYIAHVGLFFPLQKMLVLKSRKYQISDSDYTLLKQLCREDSRSGFLSMYFVILLTLRSNLAGLL